MIRWKGKKTRTIILFLGVVIFCGIALALGYYVKYQRDKIEKEEEQQKVRAAAKEWKKENYKKLEEIFLQNEEDYNIIVKNLKKEEIKEQIEMLIIDFRKVDCTWLRKESQEEACFADGELIENLEYCSQDTFDKIKNNEQLYEALKEVSKKKVIIDIVYSKDMNEIQFGISTDATPFITNNNGVTNCFIYSEADDCEKYGYKWIKDNWYMWISPRPE